MQSNIDEGNLEFHFWFRKESTRSYAKSTAMSILLKRLSADVNRRSSGEVHQIDLVFAGSLGKHALPVNLARHKKMIGIPI